MSDRLPAARQITSFIPPTTANDFVAPKKSTKPKGPPRAIKDPNVPGQYNCAFEGCTVRYNSKTHKDPRNATYKHYTREHAPEGTLCEKCDVLIKDKRHYKDHYNNAHEPDFTKIKKFPCVVCLVFSVDSQGWLTAHKESSCPEREDRPDGLDGRNWDSEFKVYYPVSSGPRNKDKPSATNSILHPSHDNDQLPLPQQQSQYPHATSYPLNPQQRQLTSFPRQSSSNPSSFPIASLPQPRVFHHLSGPGQPSLLSAGQSQYPPTQHYPYPFGGEHYFDPNQQIYSHTAPSIDATQYGLPALSHQGHPRRRGGSTSSHPPHSAYAPYARSAVGTVRPARVLSYNTQAYPSGDLFRTSSSATEYAHYDPTLPYSQGSSSQNPLTRRQDGYSGQ